MSVFKRQRNGVADATYTMKFRWQGKQVLRNTGCTSKEEAEKNEREVRAALGAGRITNLLSQLKQRQEDPLAKILDAYVGAGCPNLKGIRPADYRLPRITGYCDKLRQWGGTRSASTLTDADQEAYHLWRMKLCAAANMSLRGPGHRAAETELSTLRTALRWATRQGMLDKVPALRGLTFDQTAGINHARDRMPASGDELHRIVARLFEARGTEVFGWEALLGAFTGLRHAEMRQLLARPVRVGLVYQPGYYDDRVLVVARAKHGRNPRVQLDDPQRPYIRPVLDAIRAWHDRTIPECPYLLGTHRHARQLAVPAVLSNLLWLMCEDMGIPHRSTHGFRAYYASVRLSQGVAFERVAFELGQGSGDALIRSVYGMDPSEWMGLPNTYTWLPTDPAIRPAWEILDAPANITPLPLSVPVAAPEPVPAYDLAAAGMI